MSLKNFQEIVNSVSLKPWSLLQSIRCFTDSESEWRVEFQDCLVELRFKKLNREDNANAFKEVGAQVDEWRRQVNEMLMEKKGGLLLMQAIKVEDPAHDAALFKCVIL